MGAVKKLIDKKVLRDLVPINALSAVHIEEISRKAVIMDVRGGRYAFKKGDRDYQSIYLLEGKIELIGDNKEVVSEIHAGSEAARHPLGHKQPRQLSARAVGNVTIASIDSSLLDVLLTWDESSGYDVVEIDAQEDDDWMTRMLQSQAFLQLPPSNIHQLLMRLETIQTSAGEVIVRQGDDGDYFYIVKSGRLSVTRKASSRSKEVALAELGEGACFGEEALVSRTKRNASVTMLTDGCLMRLAQADFHELLCTPLVHEIGFPEAQELVTQGARWLDVRLPGELENQAIKGAINMPLSALRDQTAELDDDITYIVCCDTGRRSAAGAFVMSQNGFSVYTLKNGLMDVPDDMLTQPKQAVAPSKPTGKAEVIQFVADGESGTEIVSPAERSVGEGVDEDRNAAALAELNARLEEVTKQLVEAQEEIAETSNAQAKEHGALEQLKKQNELLEKDLTQTRREREELEAKLQKIAENQESSQSQLVGSMEKQKQASEKHLRELEQELEQVRGDYQQLGQRTSALGGERDAAVKDLEKAKNELQALKGQLDEVNGATSSELAELQRVLEERDKTINEEVKLRQALQTRFDELETKYSDQQRHLSSSDQQADQWFSEREQLNNELKARQEEIATLHDRLHQVEEREQALQSELGDTRQHADETLDRLKSDATEEKKSLHQQISDLQSQLDAEQERSGDQESLHAELRQKLAQAEQEFEELSARESAAHKEIQDLKESVQQAGQREDDLKRRLDESGQAADDRLARLNVEAEGVRESLNKRIDELLEQVGAQQEELAGQTSQRTALEQKLVDAEQKIEDLSTREGAARAEIDDLAENLRLARIHEQELDEQLLAAARTAEESLLQFNEDAADAQEVLNRRITELTQQVDALQEQVATHDSTRAELERKLTDADRDLAERSEQENALRQELQQALERLDEITAGAQQADQQNKEMQRQLADTRGELEASGNQIAELEAKLKQLAEGYESELHNARGALSRAQEEQDNLQREHSRLMESLRKAERSLSQQRSDHEAEVYRLQKELKEGAGESSAGLAAELEALQAKIKDGALHRDELEIQLGSRSEQLEAVRADLEKAHQRLEQAQQSAREAEQQLVEANQAASEEMTIRLDAEKKAHQELTEQRDRFAAELLAQQEQLTKVSGEADELRAALQLAETEAAGRKEIEQKASGMEEEVCRLERERDQALIKIDELRNEADQLRAEAEVTRGLIDMAPGGGGDAALREQLAESKRNVDVAVRLRGEAEAQVETLQAEVKRLQVELECRQTDTPLDAVSGEIPSLDDEDPHTSILLDRVFDEAGQDPAEDNGSGRDDMDRVSSIATDMTAGSNSRKTGGWLSLVAGLVIGVIVASAAMWFLNEQASSHVSAGTRMDRPKGEVEVPVVGLDVAIENAAPEHVQKLAVKSASQQPVGWDVPDRQQESAPLAKASKAKVEVPETEQAEQGKESHTEQVVRPQDPTAEVKTKEQKQPAGSFQDRLKIGGKGPVMIELYPETFEMGSGSISLNFNERPRHEVSLKRFAVSKNEITFDEYERFARATGRSRPRDAGWGRGTRPVINVNWADARAYAAWLSGQTGKTYRLPTEAEWEFVARGGSYSRYWWGSEVVSGRANCFDCGGEQGGRSTVPVGAFEANGFGVHDMAGNVREWVEDCSTTNYDNAPRDGSAVVTPGCSTRVVRGGGFGSPSDKLRSTARDSAAESIRSNDLGFRLVREF